MTEDEAKTKWCHQTQVWALPDGQVYFNKNEPSHDFSKCIASACMAWRWTETKKSEAFNEAVRAHMRTQAKPNAATAIQEVYANRGHEFERTEGGCGLAGAPQ